MFLETTAHCPGSDPRDHARFMHQNRIERPITRYVRRAPLGNKITAFRHVTENGVDVFYWIDSDVGYALSDHGRKAIQQLADAAYSQMLPASGNR
jgi:anti-sigma factor RsiW